MHRIRSSVVFMAILITIALAVGIGDNLLSVSMAEAYYEAPDGRRYYQPGETITLHVTLPSNRVLVSCELWVQSASGATVLSRTCDVGATPFLVPNGLDGRYDVWYRVTHDSSRNPGQPLTQEGTTGPYWLDTTAPFITITSPTRRAYAQGEAVQASYTCDDMGGSGVAASTGCQGTAANGAAIDTTTPGSKTFEVVAVDNLGHRRTQRVVYEVNPRTQSTGPSTGSGPSTLLDRARATVQACNDLSERILAQTATPQDYARCEESRQRTVVAANVTSGLVTAQSMNSISSIGATVVSAVQGIWQCVTGGPCPLTTSPPPRR
jgi:hypothetical protein